MSGQAFRNSERNDDRFWIDRWQHDAGGAMLRQAVDQRTHSRIKIAPGSAVEGASEHPLLVNVSQRGACLWLHHSPQVQQTLSLRFRCSGNDHVLRSRVTWVRHYPAACDRVKLPRGEGWIAGITFDGGHADIDIGDIPEQILRTGDVAIDLLERDDHPTERGLSEDEGEEMPGLIALNNEAVDGIKAATRELVPVFARHFSNVRVVITRERLEFSASFRPPEQARPAQIQRRNRPAIAKEQATPVTVSASREQPAVAAHTTTAKASPVEKHQLMVIAVALAAILGATHLGVSRQPGDRSGATEPVAAIQSVPGWAQGLGLDNTHMDDWIEIKTSFALPDTIMRSAIQTLRDNDIYPPAHDLHDLSRFPAQAKRAFSLLASARIAAGEPFDLGEFEDELKSRLMAGVRFPDEAPGGRYSSLQRELYNNLVVLAVVDLLHRHQAEPNVKKLLVALRSSALGNTEPSAANRVR